MFDRCFGCMQPLAFSDAPCPHCGYDGRAKQFDRNHLPPGTVLQKRYVLGAALGLGGFGNTYIGWDPMTQMRVTVKEYLPSAFAHHRADSPAVQCDSDEARALFEKGLRDYCAQAAALRRLPSTECVNPILDVVRENGTAYTVMEYLSGKTLKAYLSEYRAMSFPQAMDVMAPILRTLDTVHKNGLLHRDICPDNIFLCRNGQVRILDFGLAQYDLMPDSSESLSVLFKPGFAPPEQYMRHLLAGPWTDVYGAAATLYKMITGIAPPDVPQRQRGDTLLAPHELGCDMPQSAEHALLRALSLRPEDRYATAEVFLRALTEDDPQDEDDADESKSDALRKILRISAVAAVIIAVCIGAAAWITHRPKTDPDRTNDPTQITAVTENDETIGANVVYFDGFQPSAVEVLRTQNGDAAALPYVVFTRDGRRGLVSQTGETLLPAQYNTIVWDTETQSFLLDGSTHRSLTGEPAPQPADETQAGDPEKQPSYSLAYTYEGDALYRTAGGEKLAQGSATGGFLVCTGDKYGIVTGGTVLVEPHYEKATALCCGIAAFLEDDKWTYRNQYGIDILGQSFDASVFPNGIPFSYSDGFVPIYDAESGLWGYADTAGQMRVEPQFLTALPPVQSVAWVQTKDGFGVIRFGGENGTITGKCGENAQYTFTPGTGLLEIDGFGEM